VAWQAAQVVYEARIAASVSVPQSADDVETEVLVSNKVRLAAVQTKLRQSYLRAARHVA
jgi:hypothetical protein